MPYSCCVPNCRGNYDGNNKVSVFKFPQDPLLKEKWVRAIPRKDLNVTNSSRVCEAHFKPSDIKREDSIFDEKTGRTVVARMWKPVLLSAAVPCIFPNCPPYLSNNVPDRESRALKRQKIEESQIAKAMEESRLAAERYKEENCFSNFSELISIINRVNVVPEKWINLNKVSTNKDKVIFIMLTDDDVPQVIYIVTVNKDLELAVSYKGHILPQCDGIKLPTTVGDINNIFNLLHKLETQQNKPNDLNYHLELVESLLCTLKKNLEDQQINQIDFLIGQLKLFFNKPEKFRYSSNLLIFSSLLFYISPQAYKFLRQSGNLILPDPSTIRKISAKSRMAPQYEMQDTKFLLYAKQMISSLEQDKRIVVMMIDEIYIQPFLDFKGGNIVGMSYNNVALASSAHVFMIQSILSSFKGVVHIVPTNNMSAENLFNLIRKVLIGLENAGYKVIAIVTDNNAINRKAMTNFCSPPKLSHVYPHPVDPLRPLFFAIDSVHLIKCVRNNWINQKNGQNMYYPHFDSENEQFQTASFGSIRKMYELESNSLLKFGYGLTRKALWPTNLERQNVKLALKIFNTNVANGLQEFGPKHSLVHTEETSKYIGIFCTWWDIMNVKTPWKGKRKRNAMCEPLTCAENDDKYLFLHKFMSWLDRWGKMNSDNGRLTRETHSALLLTTEATVGITEYCISELKMSYLLPGKIQTDKLESRFGQYRTMAGSQYNVSVRQIYETESKLRVSQDLYLQSFRKGEVTVSLPLEDTNEFNENKEPIDASFYDINIVKHDIEKVKDSIPVITYLAGYCAHVALKRIKCDFCKNHLVIDRELTVEENCDLIKICDRGGLLYPTDFVINAVLYSYILVQKLISQEYEDKFLKLPNHRYVVMQLSLDILKSNNLFSSTDSCINGHKLQSTLKLILKSASNTFLNNYCKNKNDLFISKKKVRKLKTLANK